MGWRDLLQTQAEVIDLPWVGGRSLRRNARTWKIDDDLPEEHGWFSWQTDGRHAIRVDEVLPAPDTLGHVVSGYLVGDRVIPDGVRVDPDPARIIRSSERVHLIEPGLDRFVRIQAGRTHEDGPLIYREQEMPLGPEDDVQDAYLELLSEVDEVKDVTPALDAAFRLATHQRWAAEERRRALDRKRLEEEEARAREERRQQLANQLGDAAGRRAMAKVDFEEAARASLAVGGAQYLDHRRAVRRGEMVVRFRLNRRRFECTCDEKTLRIIDSGICLINHETEEKGDTYFTLESLPGVIQQADREGALVVFRHVD